MPELIDKQASLDIAMSYCPDDDGCCSKAGHDLREMLDEIEALPTIEADIDRAAILRLCNGIEDVFDELCGKYEFQLYYYSEIMKRLKAIGKELTGNEQL